MLESKQFVKKPHALSSSTVNVVCAKVTAATSSQDMWDRMNHVSTRRSVDNYDPSVSNENDPPDQSFSTDEENEEEGEIPNHDQSSEIDIMDDSSSCSDIEEQTQIVTSDASNLFQFKFEFGSKRPPTKPIIESDEESREPEQDQVTENDQVTEVESEEEDYFQQESLSEQEEDDDDEHILINQDSEQDDDDDSFNLSNDEEEEWERRGKL